MKALIIYFSPTGNTRFVANSIQKEFQKKKIETQLLDVTRNEILFQKKNAKKFFEESVEQHDILMIGSPIYAHHIQYHMLDLIRELPKPDQTIWGNIAIPFVTYGGIESGSGLEESAKLLKKSGRKVIGGLKFSASHKMTRAFLETEFNAGKPDDSILSVIRALATMISKLDLNDSLADNSKALKYQSRKTTFINKIIFNERKFHETRYPNPVISYDKCVQCRKCISSCPVFHWELKDKKISGNPNNSCIHCYNCVYECITKAIQLTGNLEKGRAFMNKLISQKGNKEQPANLFYN